MANLNLKIIGLSGTNGSGKDTVGHILADQYGYYFISVTDLLRDEAKKRGLPVERQYLRQISAEWRRELGLGMLIDKALIEYKKVESHYQGLVMASLRNPGEADRVHELNGTVIWIDATPELRYARVQDNMSQRGRAGEDSKTFEEFMNEEKVEMQSSGDKATLNMLGVKIKADITLMNNFSDLNDLSGYVAEVLGLE